MKLKLYYTPIACSMVPYINLVEAGAEFDVHVVDVTKREQNSPEYLKLNPKHKVPTLVIDGSPLTENVAINLWIARNFPGARLLPSNPTEEFQAIAHLAWCASGIHPAVSLVGSPKRYCDVPGTEANVRMCGVKLLDEHFTLADSLLSGREWFFDHFTAVDSHFFWTFLRAIRLAPEGLDIARYPNCDAHLTRMKTRASVQRLLEFEKQALERVPVGR